MDKQTFRQLINEAHNRGNRVALFSCSHVPKEILEAAGFVTIRLAHIEGLKNNSPIMLPSNLCPVVKECCIIFESDEIVEADLIIAESSCDGKKKMYELLTNQHRLYYFQIPQGEDRDYARPLILSEMEYLRQMLHTRFGTEIDNKKLCEAITICAAERSSIMELAAVQKNIPPKVWGMELYELLLTSQEICQSQERIDFLKNTTIRLMNGLSSIPVRQKRILLTGCPLQSVYQKIIGTVERNGGVVVCFENCEFIKSNIRKADINDEAPLETLADIYQDTACAIMSPNERRFHLLHQLAQEYQIDGIVDILLQTCHVYSIEKDKLRRFCINKNIHYMAIETANTNADIGQLETRIAAFIEML